MVKVNNKKNNLILDPNTSILIFSFLITLCINPGLADPFNSPKFWLLILFGSWLLGFIVIRFKIFWKISGIDFKIFFILLAGFVISLLISALNTKDLYNGFFGEVQRRLGFTTYFYFSIFMLSAAIFFKVKHIYKIYKFVVSLSLILLIYGVLQNTGNDLIKWDNPYNSIILTLGNPNYASAFMAVLATLIFALIFEVKNMHKIILILLIFSLVLLILLSNSRQGLVSFGIGIAIVLIYVIYHRSKKLGAILISCTILAFSLIFLGMLQIGPFTQYIYKASVSIRGYYWRAGYDMFISNIFTGVGVDSYGEYFKIFRNKQYPLNYGFQITSDNAHNVPIQIFATSGFFTGIFYLFLIFYILILGLKAIINSNGKSKILVVGIFASWISYLSQSIISIDNIGLTVWGWLLGGILVGLGLKDNESTDKNLKSNNLNFLTKFSDIKQKMISSILVFAAFILCSYLYLGEKYMYQVSSFVNLKTSQQTEIFEVALENLDKAKLVDPAYRFRAANILFQIGQVENSKNRVQSLINSNPENYDYLFGMAQIYASKNEWESVARIRELIKKVDPWNAENYFVLAESYKNLGNYNAAIINYKKILTFAQNETVGKEAELALKGIMSQ